MSEGAQDGFQLIQTKLRVEGNNSDIIFSNLVINQVLADVNSFSFIWRQEEGEPSMSAHVTFYKKYLGKEVTISIQSFNFKGIVDSIRCVTHDELGVDYEIIGTGTFGKLNEVRECNSFIKKNLEQIFKDLNTSQGTTLKTEPKNTKELFYTVQYNQTTFDFYRMLAIRYGEWLYYNGTQLVLGPPKAEAVTLKLDVDVHDIQISAKNRKATNKGVGYDHYKGEVLDNAPSNGSFGSGLLAASTGGGDLAFGSSHAATHFSNAANKDVLKEMTGLQQKAAAAASVYITGTTHNTNLTLGGKIKLVTTSNSSEGEYVISHLRHTCDSTDNYSNHFTAIPSEVEVPPYTDAMAFPVCRSQPATVTDNEDKDGLDRIKVHLPWQKNGENTPWLSVLTPHAGKDKGIRFLPEVGEEVLVSFVDNNAEKPFVLGAVFTEANQSGETEAGNKKKVIGTLTGRRLEIDEENQQMLLSDNFKSKTAKNIVNMSRDDSNTEMLVNSMKDESNYSGIKLKNSEMLNIAVIENGQSILEVLLEKGGKKITIQSKGDIEINADRDITLKAQNVTINASQELKMEGKAKGVDLSGQKIALDAMTTMDVKGLTTKVEGTAKLELSSAALASMEAALVKIN